MLYLLFYRQRCLNQWLKYTRAHGNAFPPSTENGSRCSPISNFLWTQRNGRENDTEMESAQTVFQTPVSDRVKLEYCGARWVHERLAMGARAYSSGAHNHTQGPNPASTNRPPRIFHFNQLQQLRERNFVGYGCCLQHRDRKEANVHALKNDII